jgi:hypothetical protein
LIKDISIQFKKSGFSNEEFNKYWREIHGPLCIELTPEMKHYVQNHLIRAPGVKYQGDGFAEHWWDDPEIEKRLKAGLPFFTTNEKGFIDTAKQKVGEDAGKFVAIKKLVKWTVEEHIIKDSIKTGDKTIKLMCCVYKKPEVSHDKFNRWWLESCGPAAVNLMPGLVKYIQNHIVRIPGFEYQGDGIAELWFDDPEIEKRLRSGLPAFQTSKKVLPEDASRFLDLNKVDNWVVQEHILK